MSYRLGVNTGFAVNRFSEPEEWTRICGEELGIKYIQFTADMLNPGLPDGIVKSNIERIIKSCENYDLTIQSTFTGAFTRVNHLAHPDSETRLYWIDWFKKFIDLTVALGASSMGSHFGIFTAKDNNDNSARSIRRKQNIECWHLVGEYAAQKGLNYLSWEPMSISREQGETIKECRRLQDDVNNGSPIPFKLCIDVDHGDLSSYNVSDTNPYAWIDEFSADTTQLHLKQSSKDKSGHWPFIAEYNEIGKIQPDKIITSLEKNNVSDIDLIFEFSFRERQPADSDVIPHLVESVNYWRPYIKN
jgi:sugar phosphate isomerase/epimerase